MCGNQDYKHEKSAHCTRRFLSRVTFPLKPIFSVERYVLFVLVLYIRKFPTVVSAWTLQVGIVFISSKGTPLADVRNVHSTRVAGRCKLVGRSWLYLVKASRLERRPVNLQWQSCVRN